MSDITEFPSRLRKVLTMKNMSQAQLCRMTGISKGTISKYLSGQRHATDINMYLISKALNVDIVWLMGYGNEDDTKIGDSCENEKDALHKLINTMNKKQIEMVIKFIKSFVLINQ